MTQDEKKFQEWHEFDVGKKNALGIYIDPMVAIAWDAWKARTEQLDALADALADLLDAVVNRDSHDSINNQIIAAAISLGKYRGEK